MMKPAATTRAPRGTKPVTQAFFAALDAIPEAARAAVAKSALASIRDEMKAQKEKMRVVAAKEKEKAKAAKRTAAKPAPAASPVAKAAPAKATPVKAAKAAPAKAKTVKETKPKTNGIAEEHEAPAPKRRGRKPAEAPTAE